MLRCWLFAIIVCVMNVAPATAQVPGAGAAVGGVVAAKVGRDLVNQLQATGAALIGQGEASGNAMMIRAGNEMAVLAQNLLSIAGSEIDKRVDHMTAKLQPVMAQAQALLDHKAHLVKGVYDIKDSTVLDLRSFAASYPLGSRFFVQKIDGSAQLNRSAGAYTISVWGVALGQDSDKIRSEVRLAINGFTLPVERDGAQANIASFTVPVEALNSLFKQKQITTARAEFIVTQQNKGWFWWSRPTTYHVPFKLVLFPTYAGQLKLNVIEPTYAWQALPDNPQKQDRATGDHNCARCKDPPHVPYMLTIEVPSSKQAPPLEGDERLVSKSATCEGGACPWTSLSSLEFYEGNTRVAAQWQVWGSPVTLHLRADAERYTAVGEKTTPQTVDLYYDQVFSVRVPNALGVRTDGQIATITGDTSALLLGNNDTRGLVSLQQKVPGPGYDTYQYLVLRPSGL